MKAARSDYHFAERRIDDFSPKWAAVGAGSLFISRFAAMPVFAGRFLSASCFTGLAVDKYV